MRWQDLRKSGNVEDQRGMSGKAMALGGGGIGTLVIIIIYALLGGDPNKLSSQLGSGQAGAPSQQGQAFSPEEQKLADFVSRVLGDTEDVWHSVFLEMGKEYREPKLVLFTGQVQSGCGFAS